MAASNTPFQSASFPSNIVQETLKACYSASGQVAPAAAATDVVVLSNPGGRKMRVSRIGVYGLATTAAAVWVQIVKRSTLDTAGTSTTIVGVPHDSAVDPSPCVGVTSLYTANPTLGTAIGTVRSGYASFVVAAGAAGAALAWVVSDSNDKTFVLNANESLAINLNGATVTGGNLSFYFTWTEE